MTLKTEMTIKKWHVWLSVIVLGLSLLSTPVSAVIWKNNIDNFKEQTDSRLKKLEAGGEERSDKIQNVETVVLEIQVNLKTLMRSQGLEYQEGTVDKKQKVK